MATILKLWAEFAFNESDVCAQADEKKFQNKNQNNTVYQFLIGKLGAKFLELDNIRHPNTPQIRRKQKKEKYNSPKLIFCSEIAK